MEKGCWTVSHHQPELSSVARVLGMSYLCVPFFQNWLKPVLPPLFRLWSIWCGCLQPALSHPTLHLPHMFLLQTVLHLLTLKVFFLFFSFQSQLHHFSYSLDNHCEFLPVSAFDSSRIKGEILLQRWDFHVPGFNICHLFSITLIKLTQ